MAREISRPVPDNPTAQIGIYSRRDLLALGLNFAFGKHESALAAPAPQEITECTIEQFTAPQVFWEGDTAKPYVYLTIDDGYDLEQVRRSMEIAKVYAVPVTYFPVGEMVEQDPDLWREIYNDGHAIENHTYTHPFMTELRDDEIRDEILRQQDVVRRAVGDTSYRQHFLRPPYGDGYYDNQEEGLRITAVAQNVGLKIAMESVDTLGWNYDNTSPGIEAAMLDRVEDQTVPGSIIVQHTVESDINIFEDVIAHVRNSDLIPLTLPKGIR